MGYTKDTIAGFSWQSVFIAGATVVTAGKLIVLARLLTPHDFGILSLVVISLGITEAITQTGINVTIIQSKESVSYFLNTAWVIAIIRGFCMSLLVVGISFFLSWLYGEPDLLYWGGIAAVIPMIKGFINPAIITFHKNLQFFRDSAYRFSLLFVEAVATIWIASYTHSLGASLEGSIIAAVFEVFISFIFFRTRPQFEYITSRAHQIFANAKGLSISAILSYLNDNLDNFLVGKLMGIETLGYYQNSYAISHKVSFGVAQAMSHSTFPIFSRLSNSRERLSKAFIRSAFALIVLMGITSIPFFFFPRLVVLYALGDQWLPIVPAIPWLVGAALLYGLFNLSYTLFTAKQHYSTMNIHRFFVVAVFVILLMTIGRKYGIVGAAMCVFCARLSSIPLLLYSIKKTLYT